MSVVGTHCLGDAISPEIIGIVLDATGSDYPLSMFLTTLWLGWPILFFVLAIGFAVRMKRQRASKYRRLDHAASVSAAPEPADSSSYTAPDYSAAPEQTSYDNVQY
jgi:hypothetical protein